LRRPVIGAARDPAQTLDAGIRIGNTVACAGVSPDRINVALM